MPYENRVIRACSYKRNHETGRLALKLRTELLLIRKKQKFRCETPAFVLFFEHESIIFRGARLKL